MINSDKTVKAIHDIESFASIFNNNPVVTAIVNSYRDDEDDDDEDLVPTEELTTEHASIKDINIIDVLDDVSNDE